MIKMKKLIILSSIVIILINLFAVNVSAYINTKAPIKIGVLLYNVGGYFIDLLKSELVKIGDANKDTVDFIFYNAENNQDLQNKQIDELINMKADVILLNIVDTNQAGALINKIKEKNIPLVLFNREPVSLNSIKSYNKSVYVGVDACTSGNIQGQIILQEIKNNPMIDRNKDGVIEYVLLQGEENNIEDQNRSDCLIKTLNQNGIKTKEILSKYCNWKLECAKDTIESLLQSDENNIELIISNNDEMAIGAVLALQEKGYNLGNQGKYIPVVGVGGLDEAIKLINEGEMTGTVLQDTKEMANALYRIALNLADGEPSLQGLPYSFDKTGVAVRIPYNGYIIRKLPRF